MVGLAGGTKAARTRRRILASAAREFARHGYAATSLRQVAMGADLQLGSLYFHFSNKDELLAEVIREAVDSTLDEIDRAIGELAPDAGGGERLAAAIRAHLGALHRSHDRGAAVLGMVGSIPPGVDNGAREHARRYLRIWLPLVEEGQRDGTIPADLDPMLVRDLLVGALNSTIRSRPASRAGAATLADTVIQLLLRRPAGHRAPPSI